MAELIHNLGIDWKLLIAQIVNFIVLLTILRLFAYKPILKMMEDRRKKIEDGVKNAEKVEKALAEATSEKEAAVAGGHKKALEIVDRAKREGESVKAEKQREAEKHADNIVDEARAQIQREREEAFRSVKDELGNLVVLASEKLTREAISPNEHKELVDQAIKDIEQSNG